MGATCLSPETVFLSLSRTPPSTSTLRQRIAITHYSFGVWTSGIVVHLFKYCVFSEVIMSSLLPFWCVQVWPIWHTEIFCRYVLQALDLGILPHTDYIILSHIRCFPNKNINMSSDQGNLKKIFPLFFPLSIQSSCFSSILVCLCFSLCFSFSYLGALQPLHDNCII